MVMGKYMFKFFMQGNNKRKEVFKRLSYFSLKVDSRKEQGCIMHPDPAMR